jgi:molybdopterin-guanine dinucleotide biosynthesis protein A
VQPISIIVLAGGASQRMGANKALLTFDGQETLIARVARHMRPLTDDLLLVTNTPELYADLGLRQTGDLYPGKGPLAGLHAGLSAARHDWALALACDMPLVDHRLVRYMILLSQGQQAVVPRPATGALEPLHALYSKSCLPVIEERLLAGDLRMISFYAAVRVRYVEAEEIAIFDPQGRSFSNANTPEDWQRLKLLIQAQSSSNKTTFRDPQ